MFPKTKQKGHKLYQKLLNGHTARWHHESSVFWPCCFSSSPKQNWEKCGYESIIQFSYVFSEDQISKRAWNLLGHLQETFFQPCIFKSLLSLQMWMEVLMLLRLYYKKLGADLVAAEIQEIWPALETLMWTQSFVKSKFQFCNPAVSTRPHTKSRGQAVRYSWITFLLCNHDVLCF